MLFAMVIRFYPFLFLIVAAQANADCRSSFIERGNEQEEWINLILSGAQGSGVEVAIVIELFLQSEVEAIQGLKKAERFFGSLQAARAWVAAWWVKRGIRILAHLVNTVVADPLVDAAQWELALRGVLQRFSESIDKRANRSQTSLLRLLDFGNRSQFIPVRTDEIVDLLTLLGEKHFDPRARQAANKWLNLMVGGDFGPQTTE